MENITQEEIEEFNSKLTKLQEESRFQIGSEVFIDKGLIMSKVVLIPKTEAKVVDKKPVIKPDDAEGVVADKKDAKKDTATAKA